MQPGNQPNVLQYFRALENTRLLRLIPLTRDTGALRQLYDLEAVSGEAFYFRPSAVFLC